MLALPLAVISFFLSHVLWPESASGMTPTSSQVPFFIFLAALESVSFGIGVAFAIFGWPRLVGILPEDRALSLAAFIAITWMLVSWWPHDNMHRVNGMDMAGLLRIEYLFHLTLILSGFLVALFFWRLMSKSQQTL